MHRLMRKYKTTISNGTLARANRVRWRARWTSGHCKCACCRARTPLRHVQHMSGPRGRMRWRISHDQLSLSKKSIQLAHGKALDLDTFEIGSIHVSAATRSSRAVVSGIPWISAIPRMVQLKAQSASSKLLWTQRCSLHRIGKFIDDVRRATMRTLKAQACENCVNIS